MSETRHSLAFAVQRLHTNANGITVLACLHGLGPVPDGQHMFAALAVWYFRWMTFWIDTHCHLDAPEFDGQTQAVRQRAADVNVRYCVIPAVQASNFDVVRLQAHAQGDSYALGIHPLYVKQSKDQDLAILQAQLRERCGDPTLVAVGEIGLDLFVPELCVSPLRERQEFFYREQVKLAKKFELPVILHVRRSADRLLKHLRDLSRDGYNFTGIAHAFSGSEVQAKEFIKLGFKLGFGGAVTFELAHSIRRLAATLALDSIVMETDSPDIPPHWLYKTQAQRQSGEAQGVNEPCQLPRIAKEIAKLRGMPELDLMQATTRNALQALPRLAFQNRMAR